MIATPTAVTDRGDGLIFDLSIHARLAGRPTAGNNVQVFWDGLNPILRRSYRLPAQPKSGIWFLKDLHNGLYDPLESRSSDLYIETASQGACPALAYAANARVEDMIALEVACAISLNRGTNYGSRAMLETCASRTSNGTRQAAAYLSTMQGNRQVIAGVACLLAARQPEAITLFEQNIGKWSEQEASPIAFVIGGLRDTDRLTIETLGRIAINPSTRGALLQLAATALATIHTRDTTSWIDKLLDRPEVEARIQAIAGIVRLINGYPIPTAEKFQRHELHEAIANSVLKRRNLEEFHAYVGLV